jgi:hypothetical protein
MQEKLPRWAKDPRELGMPAQWPEDWRAFHHHGLEWLVSSGRVRPELFTEPLGRDAARVLGLIPARDESRPWSEFLGGRLLAGVGAELLLKGLFLKAGFSIRTPANPRADTLARLGSPEAQRLNPRVSASFGALLSKANLALLPDGRAFRPLIVAKWWRDEAAHSAVLATGDAGVHLVQLALALRVAHDSLLRDADGNHAADVAAVLRATGPVLGGDR